VHCLNAKTGEHYWQYDNKSSVWGSTYYVDGKIYLGLESNDVVVFRHDPKPEKLDELAIMENDMKAARAKRLELRKKIEEKYLLGKAEFSGHVRSTPVVANGVFYVMTETTLYAIKA